MSIEDIPAFLRIPQEERKRAWDESRKANPLPPERKLYRSINDLPAEKSDEN
jgi:hypothetical protein